MTRYEQCIEPLLKDCYVPTHPEGIRIGIGSWGGAGKTAISLVPHPALGLDRESVVYVPYDPGAEMLEGIEPEWVETGRLSLERWGWKKDGSRFVDDEFHKAILTNAAIKRPKVKTFIIDTISTMAELRRTDFKGKDPRKGFGLAQELCAAFYHTLAAANPRANIIILHHLREVWTKELTPSGAVQDVYKGNRFSVAGPAIEGKWPARFSMVFQTECRAESRIIDGKPQQTHGYYLQPRPTSSNSMMKIRSGMRNTPSEIDITVNLSAGKETVMYEPLIRAWDTLFRLVDKAREGKAAYEAAKKAAPTGGAPTKA